MAKTKNKSLQYPKPKTSFFLCCFGSLPEKPSLASSTIKGSDPIPKQMRTSCFSWRRIRMKKNSAIKTVPLEASISVEKQELQSKSKANKAHYSKPRSKSTLHKSQAPATNPPPPAQTPPVHPATPYYTPSQTRHGANNVEDTRQPSRASPTHTKRQVRHMSSSMQSQTTSKKLRNARSSYDPVVGMSVVTVTLVIMIFWGRLCAILCTSAWLCFIPRFRTSGTGNDENDSYNKNSNDLDLDSEVYKKKVIMEGLLERNHRGTTL